MVGRDAIDRLQQYRPSVPTPDATVGVAIALTAVYLIIFVAALGFAVGATLAIYDRWGLWVAVAVGSALAFVYAYVLLQVVAAITGASTNE